MDAHALTNTTPPASASRNAGGKSGPEVREMFSRVARRYDFLNHFLSLGLDIRWRGIAAREVVNLGDGDAIADLCTGTGDLAVALKKAAPKSRVIALDFTPEMAAIGPPKAARKKLDRIAFGIGDSLSLPLRENSVAAASVAFGIRNVADLDRGLREMARVVRPGGKVLVLEFTKPHGKIFGPIYMFYFRYILPFFGRMIAATAGDAYRYLPQSVQAFAGPEEMTERMRAIGLKEVRAVSMTFGVVHLYVGTKS
jgi:demethylmenaquinone methyltransferase/2-methoxy-6-polyprenyl-1,4-benzoquinol methylase